MFFAFDASHLKLDCLKDMSHLLRSSALFLILQTRNTTPTLSTMMSVKIRHRLKSWILKKFIQKQVRQVVSSIIVSIQFFNKILRPWKLFGIMPMTVSAI